MQNTIFENKTKGLKLGVVGLSLAAAFVVPSIASADSYTIQSGDTLSAIASSHNTTVSEIVSLNNITDANLISVGQTLEIGGNVATSTVATTTSSATTTETSGSTSTATSYSSNLSAADAAAKEEIAQRESGGSYTAQNGQYYGRYQLTLSYLNGDLSAENQDKVADEYVTSRYGSWTAALAFWNANGWY